MAKTVTMQELTDWVEKNKIRTWSLEFLGTKERPTFEMKYLSFQLDTRDMKVFSITTRSWANLEVDFREEFDGTILELLEHKLAERQSKKD